MLVIMLYALLYLLFGFLGNCDSASSSLVQTCSASVRGLHYFANTEPRCQFNQLKRVQEKMVKEVRHYQLNWTNRTEMIERVHHCRFNWTNRKKMVEKARERITHRQKLFLRFKVPVYSPTRRCLGNRLPTSSKRGCGSPQRTNTCCSFLITSTSCR